MSDTWIKFFKASGLPPNVASHYASLFADHRIRVGMLPELNKELLRDIGISAVGDVITILKYARLRAAAVSESDEDESPLIKKTALSGQEKFHRVIAAAEPVRKRVRTTAPSMARLSRDAPDADVGYTVRMPSGNTQKSRALLAKTKKAPTQSATPSKLQSDHMDVESRSVFARLGGFSASEPPKKVAQPKQPLKKLIYVNPAKFDTTRKTVVFSRETKVKEYSPDAEEISSTTNDEWGCTLESDRIAKRKISALNRLGAKSGASGAGSNSSPMIATGGTRIKLTAARSGQKATLADRLGGSKPSIKDRLGGSQHVSLAEATSTTGGDVFSRLGSKPSAQTGAAGNRKFSGLKITI